MWKSVLTVCLFLLPTFVLAQQPTDRLREMLTHVPADIVVDGTYGILWGNPQALLTVTSPAARNLEIYAFARGLPAPIRQYGHIYFKEFEEAVGFGAQDVLETFSIGEALDFSPDLLVMRVPAEKTRALGHTLATQNYSADDTRFRNHVWVRGDDDSFEMANRLTASPFGGLLGSSGRITIDGEDVIYARSWAAFDSAFGKTQKSLAQSPQVLALLDALDASSQGSPVSIELYLSKAGSPIGRERVLIADITDGAADVGILAIVARGNEKADDLAARLVDGWSKTKIDILGATLEEYSKLTPEVVSYENNQTSVVVVSLRQKRTSLEMNSAENLLKALVLRGVLPAILGG